jgi:hypothetical protein
VYCWVLAFAADAVTTGAPGEVLADYSGGGHADVIRIHPDCEVPMTDIAFRAMEEAVARALEPDPGPLPDFDALFSHQMDGEPLQSPGGAYNAVSIFDDGDEPSWQPRRFGSSAIAAADLIEALRLRGVYVWTSSMENGYHSDVWIKDDEFGRADECPAQSEAVLRAVHAALVRMGGFPPAAT